MEKGRIEFLITSLEPGGNSEPIGNVQIFFYINLNYIINLWGLKPKSSLVLTQI